MTIEAALQHYVAAPNGCWLWLGTTDKDGYPYTSVEGRTRRIHRLSLETKLGRPLGHKMQACHECNTPLCIRPCHLREDTNHGNILQSVAEGRWQRGHRHYRAKLSEDAALSIYADDRPTREIAEDFGVTPEAVHAIKIGRNWRWLTHRA